MLAVSSLCSSGKAGLSVDRGRSEVEDRRSKLIYRQKRVNDALPLRATLCLSKSLLTHQTPTFNLTRKEERKAKGRRASKPRTKLSSRSSQPVDSQSSPYLRRDDVSVPQILGRETPNSCALVCCPRNWPPMLTGQPPGLFPEPSSPPTEPDCSSQLCYYSYQTWLVMRPWTSVCSLQLMNNHVEFGANE